LRFGGHRAETERKQSGNTAPREETERKQSGNRAPKAENRAETQLLDNKNKKMQNHTKIIENYENIQKSSKFMK
jgi:hypothetical protein